MLLNARRISATSLLLLTASGASLGGQLDSGTDQTPAAPGRGEAGHGSLTTQLGLYNQLDRDGDNGNPFVDETLTVIEPAIILDYNATDRLGATATVTYDHISSASIDRIPDRTKKWYGSDYALGTDVALRYWSSDQLQFGGHAGYNAESDFRSFALGGKASLGRVDQNATVTLSVDGFRDSLDVVRFDGSTEGWDQRTTVTATADWYQVLSPTLHGEFGVTVSHQSGFLETPFNAVVIEDPALPPNPNLSNNARGREITEELPDTRTRGALFGRVRRWLRPGTAVELGGRVYDDSWGIESVSIEPRLYQNLWSPVFRMRLRYRYYIQSSSKYFKDHFDEVKEYRTQDSDLGDFSSHTVGGKITWDVSDVQSCSLGGDYVLRSDKLNQTFFTLTWVRKF